MHKDNLTVTLSPACIGTSSLQEDGENYMWFNIYWPLLKVLEKVYQGNYPLHVLYILKVKMLKWLQFGVSELLELHGNRTRESDGPCE
jgi:hypothetical protein